MTAPIPIQSGETVERDGFIFTDLLPRAPPSWHTMMRMTARNS